MLLDPGKHVLAHAWVRTVLGNTDQLRMVGHTANPFVADSRRLDEPSGERCIRASDQRRGLNAFFALGANRVAACTGLASCTTMTAFGTKFPTHASMQTTWGLRAGRCSWWGFALRLLYQVAPVLGVIWTVWVGAALWREPAPSAAAARAAE